jgi:hypothetical protein
MQLVSWYAWEFVGDVTGSSGTSFSQELNLPNGTYSAFCAINAATVTQAPNPFSGITCGIYSYQANGNQVVPTDVYGSPFIFPTDNLTQITFQFLCLPTSSGSAYIYVSGWE